MDITAMCLCKEVESDEIPEELRSEHFESDSGSESESERESEREREGNKKKKEKFDDRIS